MESNWRADSARWIGVDEMEARQWFFAFCPGGWSFGLLSLSVRPHSPDIRAPTARCLPLANVRNSLYFSFYVSVLLLLLVVPSLHGLTRAPLAPSLSLFRSSFGARSRPYRYRYDDDDDKDRSRALTTTDFQPPPVIEVFFSFFPSPVVPVIPLIPSIVDRCLSTRAPV